MANVTKDVKWNYNIGDIIKDDKRNMTIIDRYIVYDKNNRIKHYNFKCNKCGWEHGDITESSLKRMVGCPVCCHNPQTVVEGINDIPTTAPWMIPYFQGGYDEAKLYTRCSEKRIYPICPVCGKIKDKAIKLNNIYHNHSIGCICSDGISYPEKFLLSILNQLNIDYIYQLTKTNVNWIDGNIRYDFSILNKSCIIETHGEQHYEEKGFSITLEEQQLIDANKEQLAKENNIQHYIVLDCRKSNMDWIKKSVMESELPALLNFKESDIDWLKCEEFALKNLVKEVCEYKNSNPSLFTKEIASIFSLSAKTINEYLKSGWKLGWCTYDSSIENKRQIEMKIKRANETFSKKVAIYRDNILLDTFNSLHDLERQSESLFDIRLTATKISKVCNGKKPQYKGFTFQYI